ncbi:YodC family protein [Agrobacterium rosae]
MEFKVGDVVQLKSGGPHMTISSIGTMYEGSELYAWCDWFVQDKAPWKKEDGTFPLTSLKKEGF